MDFQVIWSKSGIHDLAGLVRYIAIKDHADTARQFGELMITKVDRLVAFPRIGRMVPEYREDGLREVIVPPYRIVYEIDDVARTITVLRIWHGARGELEMPD